jgi:hypothetical protein
VTVTFLKPSGVPLASQDEPLSFVCTADPAFIGVRFGGIKGRELAYHDGAFVGEYTQSSKVGNVYTLRRDGGWPAQTTPIVDTGAVAGPPTWKKVWSVNFAAQTPRTFPSSGKYTIDGKDWYLKQGAIPVSLQHPRIDATGLGWSMDFGNGDAPGYLDQNPGSVIYPHWFLPLSQIPEYDPAFPWCVRAHGPDSSPMGWAGLFVGFTSCTNDGVAHTEANQAYDAFVGRYGSSGLVSRFGFNQYSATSQNLNGRSGVGVISVPGAGPVHIVVGSNAPSWQGFAADPSAMAREPEGRIAYSGDKVALPRPNPGILLMGLGPGMPGAEVGIPALELWAHKS